MKPIHETARPEPPPPPEAEPAQYGERLLIADMREILPIERLTETLHRTVSRLQEQFIRNHPGHNFRTVIQRHEPTAWQDPLQGTQLVIRVEPWIEGARRTDRPNIIGEWLTYVVQPLRPPDLL